MKHNDKPQWSVWPVYVFVAVFSFALFSFTGIDLISNDGSQYLSTAKNIANGNGLSTSVLYYDQHFAPGTIPTPQAMWPPAYPIFLSIFASFTDKLDVVTIIVNLVLHAFSGWLIYGLILRIGATQKVATTFLVIYFLVAQGWLNAIELRTEPLFLIVSLAVFRFLPERSDSSGLSWFLVGLGVGLATAIRYVGVVELLAVLMLMATTGISQLLTGSKTRFFKTFINSILVTIGASLLIAPTLIRNYWITGTITPRSGQDEALSLIGTLDSFVYATAGLLGFSAHGSLPDVVRNLVFIVLSIALIGLIGLQCLKRRNRNRFGMVIQLSIWCTAIGFGLFMWSGMTTSPTNLNVRYLHSWLIIAMPAFVWLVYSGRAPNTGNSVNFQSQFTFALTTVVLVILAVGQVDNLFSKRHQLGDISFLKNSIEQQTDSGLTLRELTAQCVPQNRSLLTNRSQQLHRLLDVPTIGMALKKYTSMQFTSERLLHMIDQYRISLVVLYTYNFAGRSISDEKRQQLNLIIDNLENSSSFEKLQDSGSTYIFRNTRLCPGST